MFRKNKDKPKTEKQLKKDLGTKQKAELDYLLALRHQSELKMEKSAILTLQRMNHLVKSQLHIIMEHEKKIKLLEMKLEGMRWDLNSYIASEILDVAVLKTKIKETIIKHG